MASIKKTNSMQTVMNVKNIAATTTMTISPMNAPARLCSMVADGYPLPGPGTYARHNAVDMPARLPDGSSSALSVSEVLTGPADAPDDAQHGDPAALPASAEPADAVPANGVMSSQEDA